MSKAPKYPNEDLFEATKMSFGEHIEELRSALIKSLIGVVIGVFVGLYVGGYVVDWIKLPLEKALASYYEDKAITGLKERYGGEVPLEVETVVRERHIAPEEMNLDPVMLSQNLRQYDPELFDKLTILPYRFVPDDVRSGQAATLCRKLVAGQEEENSHAHRIWELLSPAARQRLAQLATDADAAEAAAGRAEMVEALNDVAAQAALYTSAEFQDLLFLDPHHIPGTGHAKPYVTAEALRQSLAEGNAGPDDARRLNRLLMAYSFPQELRPPQMNLVTLTNWKPIIIHVQTLSAHEAFTIYMKAAIISGFVLAAPWIFIQVWNFVAAGLYPHEKRYVHLYLPISMGLFLGGAALAFFFVFAPVLEFLFQFNESMRIDPDPRISEWLGFVLILPLGFGIGFQLPLVMLFLNRVGIVSIATYISHWRIAILTIFVVAMVLTPADPVSMLFMAIPLTVLYFGGILLCKWMPRGRNPFTEAYEP